MTSATHQEGNVVPVRFETTLPSVLLKNKII